MRAPSSGAPETPDFRLRRRGAAGPAQARRRPSRCARIADGLARGRLPARWTGPHRIGRTLIRSGILDHCSAGATERSEQPPIVVWHDDPGDCLHEVGMALCSGASRLWSALLRTMDDEGPDLVVVHGGERSSYARQRCPHAAGARRTVDPAAVPQPPPLSSWALITSSAIRPAPVRAPRAGRRQAPAHRGHWSSAARRLPRPPVRSCSPPVRERSRSQRLRLPVARREQMGRVRGRHGEKTARPSAPPTCCAELSSAAASPALSRGTPALAAVVTATKTGARPSA